MSLRVFWNRNLAFFKLAVASNVEYRLNYVVDAIVQPLLHAMIELLLWTAIFRVAGVTQINGFGLNDYMAYALWAAFFARIAASWMYEFRMIEEIESGTINSLLTRPISFYECYFSQLMGYKAITTFVSFLIPLTAVWFLSWPADLSRLPLAILLVFYYLVLVHSISFVVSCCAFFLNRIYAFTVAKNLAFWILTGELLPLDLMPSPFREWVIALPFSSGVYLPVGYITGRVELPAVLNGFVSVTVGLVVVNLIGWVLWKRGLRTYSGTGA